MRRASNVTSYVNKLHRKLDKDIQEATSGCESPIEELLAIGLMYVQNCSWNGIDIDLNFQTQYEVEANGKKYRADFLVTGETLTFTEDGYPDNEVISEIIVECDGFAYHSSKEQIERDNRRDRNLKSAGYTVLHFSGSEINRNPIRCATEVVGVIRADLLEKKIEGRG